jgi:hypothetical protein
LAFCCERVAQGLHERIYGFPTACRRRNGFFRRWHTLETPQQRESQAFAIDWQAQGREHFRSGLPSKKQSNAPAVVYG